MHSGGFAQAGAGSQPGEFSSADGAFRVLYIEAAPKLTDYRDAITWVNEVKALADSLKLPPDTTLGFTGEPVFMAEISASMQLDMQLSGILTLIIVAAIFWLCHRHIRPLFYLLALLVLIFVLTLGIAGIFLPDLTVMGVGFASIMIGLSVDYGYVLSSNLGAHGKERRRASQRMPAVHPLGSLHDSRRVLPAELQQPPRAFRSSAAWSASACSSEPW